MASWFIGLEGKWGERVEGDSQVIHRETGGLLILTLPPRRPFNHGNGDRGMDTFI